MSLSEQKFTFNELKWAVVLSYLHGNGLNVVELKKAGVKMTSPDLEVILADHMEKEAQFLRFMIWAREIDRYFAVISSIVPADKSEDVKKKFDDAFKNDAIINWNMRKLCFDRLGGMDNIDIILGVDFTKVFAKGNHKDKIRQIVNEKAMHASTAKYIVAFTEPGKSASEKAGSLNKFLYNTDQKIETLWSGTAAPAGAGGIEGGFIQEGGVDYMNVLLSLVMNLPAVKDPSTSYKQSMGMFGIAVPILAEHYTKYVWDFTQSLPNIANQSKFGDKLYVFKFEGDKFSITRGGTDVPNTLIKFADFSTEDMSRLGIKNQGLGAKTAVINACARGTTNDCLNWFNNNINAEDKISNDGEFNNVNPRLVIDLLDKLKWPWIYNKENGNTIKTYGISFKEYKEVRSKEGENIPDINLNAKVFLEKCAVYINQEYISVLNDGNLAMKEINKKFRKFDQPKNTMSFPIMGLVDPNGESKLSILLKQVNGIGMNTNIMNRNNAYGNLLKSMIHMGGNQHVLPIGFDMFNTNQSGGGIITHNMPVFYEASISKLLDALTVAAHRSVDQSSKTKIDNSLNAFKTANSEMVRIYSILRQYNQINAQNKDPKYNVSLEDMHRYNTAFTNSIEVLNKSEIKLSKIITLLQQELIDAFNKKISKSENRAV